MARLRGALRSLRARVANCSIRTAFALYAAAAMLAGLALSVVASGLLGYLAEASLPEDPYAHAGYYVLDADAGELVPAEALSWYETPAYDAVAERGAGGGDSVVLYVASRSDSGRLPVPLDDPPVGVRDGSAQDLALLMDEEDAPGIPFGEIAAYDAAASAARPGSEAAEALAAELPGNADGERPVVSNVGYYLPYPKDPQPYRLAAWAAVASVPAAFVACVVVAGRRFYRARLEGPIAAIDEAARRIAASDLDFSVEPSRDDELGRLCGQIEAMRAELECTEGELWRAAEGRRQVNAAFAHDLRTPLTVIRGQAELVGRLSGEPVELAAGYLFGFWEGTAVCLAGGLVGTLAVTALVRALGMRAVRALFSAEQLEGVSWLRDSARFELLMLVVFLIPGTPKDVLTYVAGLTDCRWWRIAAIATVGRIPSVVTSTLAAGFASQGDWVAAGATLAATVALVGAGAAAYAAVRRREAAR